MITLLMNSVSKFVNESCSLFITEEVGKIN
jgi:hypothetical protein